MKSSSQFKSNLCFIKSKIKTATQQSGKTAEEIIIVAVTKTLPIEAWNIATEEGLTSLGESRIKEAENKIIQFNYIQKVDFYGHTPAVFRKHCSTVLFFRNEGCFLFDRNISLLNSFELNSPI